LFHQPQDHELTSGSAESGIVLSGEAGTETVGLASPAVAGGGGPLVGGAAAPRAAFSLPTLLQAKWLIVGVFTLVAGATVPLIWWLLEPHYQATALVRVSPLISRIVFDTEDKGTVPLYRSFLNTQVSIMRSPRVLQRVLDQPEVQQTRWYREVPRTLRTMLGGQPPSHLERLEETLSVHPRRDTELIDVSVTARSPHEAKLIANAVVDAYKRFTDETYRESDVHRFETLSAERAALKKEIDGLVESKFNLGKQLGTLDPEELRSQLATQLSVLEAKANELQRQIGLAGFVAEELRPAAEVGPEATPPDGDGAKQEDIDPTFAQDAEWRALHLAWQTARHQLAVAGQQYGSSHPRIRQLQADVDHQEQLLHDREAALQAAGKAGGVVLASDAAAQLTSLAQAERTLRLRERELGLLREDVDRQRQNLTEAGELAKKIAHYDDEIRYTRELYDAVRTRLEYLEIEAKAPARISIAASAVAPTEPFRDRRPLLSGLALGAALCLALAAGYVRALLDPRIRELGDVQQVVQVPFLGQLPPLPAGQNHQLWEHSSAVIEGMRMVRTALLRRLEAARDQVVLVTSSSSRAGKTSVALSLARSLAQLGKRTLLVEADLRQAALAERLGLDPSAPGLAAILTGMAEDDEVVRPDECTGLDIMLAGTTGEFNPELLANGVFAGCLKRWRSRYDYVVLDSPPVMPVADARILATQADGILMVLRSSHCRRSEVLRAYADLDVVGGRLLGTVLVGVLSGAHYGYGQYGYGSYGYGGYGRHQAQASASVVGAGRVLAAPAGEQQPG